MLAASDADKPVPPASLTKLMTAYVVFEALEAGKIHLDDEAPVSKKAWRTGRHANVHRREFACAVDDLVHGMLIQSGNDASIALAEHVAAPSTAFVALMNERPRRSACRAACASNPTGLPARGHVTQRARPRRPRESHHRGRFRSTTGSMPNASSATTESHSRTATRCSWRDLGVDGMKTGFTDAAGYCIVSSAQRERHAPDRGGARREVAEDPQQTAAQELLQYGFANYETHRLYAAGEPVSAARVPGGAPETAASVSQHDCS